MNKIIFLAHDPGGYEAVFPVVQQFQKESKLGNFYCTGPAAKLNPLYGVPREEVVKTVSSLLRDRKLLLLVTGTSWGSYLELEMIAACKTAGVPTIAILDYWSNYRERFKLSTGRIIYPDYYIIMDDLAAWEAVQAGVPPEIIRILGQPGLDKFLVGRRGKRSFQEEKKKVLFLSQPLSVLYGENLGYTEQQAWEECRRAVQERSGYSLHIRFHPKDKTDFQLRYRDMAVTGELLDIMPQYDLIIGMNTMGLLQAVLMGIPAISYQPNLRSSDTCITNKLGLTRLVTTYGDLQSALNMDRQQIAGSPASRRKLIWRDGHSAERVTAFIRGMFKDEN